MRPLPDEHCCPKACNDADPGPTLRTGVRGIYLTAPLDAQARPKVQTGLLFESLTSSCGCSTPGCSGSVCPCRTTPRASRPFTIRLSTKSLPDGPMMGRSGRRLWPVCGIWRQRSTSTPACSMATGPTPWPKKGRWHWLLGVQTPEGREGHCHH